MTMWELIPTQDTPPTRNSRYCCQHLKEHSGKGRVVVTGIRAQESPGRAKKGILHKFRGKTLFNPILHWSTSDVWTYIKRNNLKYCELYDQGFKRLGCIGCPCAYVKTKKMEFERWPNYKRKYLKAFSGMLEFRKSEGLESDDWKTPEDVFEWWINN